MSASDRREWETAIVDINGKYIIGTDGKKIDGATLLLKYFESVDQFQGTEREIRETRESALSNGVSSRVKNIMGTDQLKNEFCYLKPDNLEAKLKGKSLADIIIIVTQLAQLAPLVGDIGGWFDGLVTAYSGMNVEWAKIGTMERSLNGIFWVLGITVVGGITTRAYKAKNMAVLAHSLNVIKKILPEKISDYIRTGWVLHESVQQMFMKIFPTLRPHNFLPDTQIVPRKKTGVVGYIPARNNRQVP